MINKLAFIISIVGKIVLIFILSSLTSCATTHITHICTGDSIHTYTKVRTTKHSIETTIVTVKKEYQVK